MRNSIRGSLADSKVAAQVRNMLMDGMSLAILIQGRDVLEREHV